MSLVPPFTKEHAIDVQALDSAAGGGPRGSLDHGHVPDQPTVELDADIVRDFLRRELDTPILDRMYPWLWLCATKDSKRIDPLHQQVYKGRTIIATEDPALHLIWFKDNICIKPIPLALLNHDFWMQFLSSSDAHRDRTVVLGFLRSYGLLIRHPSDFKIAEEKGLIPKGTKWLQWERFIHGFRSLSDTDVADRYHFGQIRLSRLNILIRFLRPRQPNDIGNNRHYYTTHWYTAAYLKQFVGPGLFVFGSVSLLLSAMQVILSLPTEIDTRTWVREAASISFAFWGFCITVLVLLALSWLLLLAGPVLYTTAQQVFGYYQKKDFDKKMNERGHP